MVRRDGILYVDFRCSDGKTVKVPVFFSFRPEGEEEGRLVASRFLPPGIEKHLSQREFFILKDFHGSVLVKARLKGEVSPGRYLLELLEEKMVESRIYDRFNFCPEEFGEFELRRDSEVIGRVRIADISLSGVKLVLAKEFKVKEGELLLLTQGTKIMNLQVVRLAREREGVIIGARILSTNFNLVNFIIGHYVALVKELL